MLTSWILFGETWEPYHSSCNVNNNAENHNMLLLQSHKYKSQIYKENSLNTTKALSKTMNFFVQKIRTC